MKANQSPFLILSFSICCMSTCTLPGNKHKHGTSKKIIGGSLAAKLCLTLVTPWTVAHQASLPLVFSRQEYWRGLPFASPGDLSDLEVKAGSPVLQVDSLPRTHL